MKFSTKRFNEMTSRFSTGMLSEITGLAPMKFHAIRHSTEPQFIIDVDKLKAIYKFVSCYNTLVHEAEDKKLHGKDRTFERCYAIFKDGVSYKTHSSGYIGEYATDEFSEGLYVTLSRGFFLAGEGKGYESESIKPITRIEAQSWAKKHCDAFTYKVVFEDAYDGIPDDIPIECDAEDEE